MVIMNEFHCQRDFLPLEGTVDIWKWPFFRSLHLLEKPKSSTTNASRAFIHSAPVVWNSLSANTRCATSTGSFKQLLKTELFAAALVGD